MNKDRILNRVNYVVDLLEEFFKIGKISDTNWIRLEKLIQRWKKCSEQSSPLAKYYLSPEDIYGWDKDNPLSEKEKESKIKSLPKLMGRLKSDLINFNEYRKNIGLYFHIEFHIERFGSGTKYRLLILSYSLDVAELIRTFWQTGESKQIPIKPYRELISGELVLQFPPQCDEYAEAVFFRQQGPKYIDIEKNYIQYTEKAYEVHHLLWQNDIILLQGEAASGKTTLALLLAFDWLNKSIPVKILNLPNYGDNFPKNDIIEDIIHLQQESQNALLIIEDAHCNPEALNRLLMEKAKYYPKTIITSRKINYENFEFTPVNCLKTLKTIDLDKDDFLEKEEYSEQIIRNYFKNQNWDIKGNDISNLLNISGGNLWILAFALLSLENTSTEKLCYNIVVKKFEKLFKTKIQKNFKGENYFLAIKLLITISVLSRYEIQTDVEWLKEHFTRFHNKPDEISAVLLQLYNLGELTKNGRLFGIHHSEIARLYFAVSSDCNSEWPSKKIYGDEKDLIISYVTSKNSSNKLEVFKNFARHSKLITIGFLPDDDLVEMYDKIFHSTITNKENLFKIVLLGNFFRVQLFQSYNSNSIIQMSISQEHGDIVQIAFAIFYKVSAESKNENYVLKNIEEITSRRYRPSNFESNCKSIKYFFECAELNCLKVGTIWGFLNDCEGMSYNLYELETDHSLRKQYCNPGDSQPDSIELKFNKILNFFNINDETFELRFDDLMDANIGVFDEAEWPKLKNIYHEVWKKCTKNLLKNQFDSYENLNPEKILKLFFLRFIREARDGKGAWEQLLNNRWLEISSKALICSPKFPPYCDEFGGVIPNFE